MGRLLPSILGEVLRQLGVLAEGAVRADRSLEDNARLRHGRGEYVRVGALLRRTLMKQIAVGAPASRAAFIDGAAIACSKKPSEV